MTYDQINPAIAFIQDGNAFFQVINETGDDWDEAATAQAYREYIQLKD
jgi:hypothetical protein